jgi:formylglycine-generating enzyme required for sulfatase activity
LYADGTPGAEKGDFENYIPLYLPPTGNDFRTVSLLWSLWEQTGKLVLRRDFNEKIQKNSDFNDFGDVILRKLELIPLEPFTSKPAAPQKYPELVAVPGGEFTMGGEDGSSDERPARKVKISAFAMGRYEVTNAEFEQFQPEHRKMRDGYSWRDNEPAIYVSWISAAKYCNWLSKRNGLSAVYDEETWKIDMKADGFRLPTEAEWEYVASGRGENRIYPWGNEPPTPKYGNFTLKKSLDMDYRIPATWAEGVHCAGDFPAGASRDGIMDLAGNVSEWCSDTFRDYAPGEAADPLVEAASPFRVIRGGSWGYYNNSQRNRDREYNHPGYGGYIYIGFRIAISSQGYDHLHGKR